MTTLELAPASEAVEAEAVATATPAPAPPALPVVRRKLGRVGRDDVLALGGAAVSALGIDLLLFGRLTSMSGVFGFVVVGFIVFIGIYAFIVSLDDDRPAVVDKVMAVLMASCAALAGVALVSVVAFVLWEGRKALFKANFFTEDMGLTLPNDPLTSGGITHAIVGTLLQTGIALVLTVPLGLICAVYLNEFRGRFAVVVRTVVTAMTALPSVVAGLFIFATWILVLGHPRSGLAASLAISIMMLPIMIRAADVVLRLVPGNLKEAAAALGASRWRTVWHVVLPTARSGLATSVILGVARGVGETAPVLLTAGFTMRMNTNPLENAMNSLPLATYDFARRPEATMHQRGFASAVVLMVLVLLLFTLARVLGGRPAGRLSPRQARRAELRSAFDVDRMGAARGAASTGGHRSHLEGG